MTFKLFAGPSVEPVTLAEAKVQCRIDADLTVEDSLISSILIPAAREEAEHLLRRALITQTWDLTLDAFPAVEIELAKPPVQSITSITYVNASGVTTALSAAAYVLDNKSMLEAFVLPADGYEWPETYDTANAVTIRFVAGYGDAASSVPAAIKGWILMRVATLYKFREQIQAGVAISELPRKYADRMLDRFKVWG